MNRLLGILKMQLDVADKVLGKSVRLDWRPTSTSALIIQLEICRENITWPTKWQWKWRKRQTLCSLSLADNRVESKYFKPHCWNKKIFIIYLKSFFYPCCFKVAQNVDLQTMQVFVQYEVPINFWNPQENRSFWSVCRCGRFVRVGGWCRSCNAVVVSFLLRLHLPPSISPFSFSLPSFSLVWSWQKNTI